MNKAKDIITRNRNKSLLTCGWRGQISFGTANMVRGGVAVWLVWLLACAMLLGSSVVYKVMANHLDRLDNSITLPVPLKSIADTVGGWKGEDIPLSAAVLKVAGNDDYLNRLYVNKKSQQWANVYIAYSANPRTMLGHRPQVCYPSSGWQHKGTDHIKVKSKSGREVPCLLHRFYKAKSGSDEVVVLNYYVVNGQITNEEGTFSGFNWRAPSISGDIARYVAQVQVSSTLENSVLAATKEFTDLVFEYLPDENGYVEAALPLEEEKGRRGGVE